MPRVLIAAFDGLQPSQVTPQRMPTVSKLADGGVRFLHNHAVFPTVTRGNSASIVTGATPGKHGLTANKSVFHDYSKTEVVDALVPKLPEINKSTGGNLLLLPTIGELINEHGLRWVSVVGGTSGNAYVQHPNAGDFDGVVIHPEFTNPSSHHAEIIGRFGDWPAKEAPAADLVVRTADVAIEYAIGELNPDVLLVWFPEPDTSQHAFGVDSSQAQEMYSLADAQLGRILNAIEQHGEEPDVFVVSDHGYSTIDTVVDVSSELANAGFNIFTNASNDEGTDDEFVVVAENGGSVLLYVPDKQAEHIDRLTKWLVAQEWVGAVAAASGEADDSQTATLGDIGMDGRRSPDIAVTMRSRQTGKAAPHARAGVATGGRVGVGSHGGGSSAELHNTLIGSGPSFRAGVESNLASGNIDIAPTVLELLGLPASDYHEGRVLTEALNKLSPGDSSGSREESLPSKNGLTTRVRVGGTGYLCEFG